MRGQNATARRFSEPLGARGVLVGFHGSWNRAPLPQDGFNVVFQLPMTDGRPTGESYSQDGF
jgi:glucose/arabinose dehydrogenase